MLVPREKNLCYQLCPSLPEIQQRPWGPGGWRGLVLLNPGPHCLPRGAQGPALIFSSEPKHAFYPVGKREPWEVFEQDRDQGQS